ncbi:MAG: hypothetical protein LBL79_02595 [Prevotella sp.]|jgi:hypothetical protein|nr:hypothetical protein [Prevotella sp.]
MPIYTSRGKTYNIPDDRVNDFLSKRSDAKQVDSTPYYLSRANSTPRGSNNQKQSSATAGETTVQQENTGLYGGYTKTKDGVEGFLPFSRTQDVKIERPYVGLPSSAMQGTPFESRSLQDTFKESGEQYRASRALDPDMVADRAISDYGGEKDFIDNINKLSVDDDNNIREISAGAKKALNDHYKQNIRPTSEDAGFDIKNLPPAIRDWLKENEQPVTKRRWIPTNRGMGEAGYWQEYTDHENTPEQKALAADFSANSPKGWAIDADYQEYLKGLDRNIENLWYKITTAAKTRGYSLQDIQGAIGLRNELVRLRDAVKDGDSGFVEEFRKELGRRLPGDIADAATFGLSQLYDKAQLSRSMTAQTPGGELVRETYDLLGEYQQAHQLDRSMAQDIAQGTSYLAPVIAQFTGTAGLARAATLPVLRGLSSQIAKRVRSKLGRKFLTGAAETSLQAGFMTLIQPQTLTQAYQNSIDNPGSFLDNYTKSFVTNFVENHTELLGKYLPELPVTRLRNKTLRNVAKKTGVQGGFGEWQEEQFGIAEHALFGDGEAQWSDFVDPRKQGVTFGVVYMGQLPYLSIAAGGYAAGKYRNIQQKRSIRKGYNMNLNNMNNIFGNESADLISAINEIVDKSKSEHEISGLMNDIVSDSELNDSQKEAAFKYTLSYIPYSALNQAKTEQVREATRDIPATVQENVNPDTNSLLTVVVSGIDVPAQVVKGLQLNTDGSINKNVSDKQVFYKDPVTKETKVTSIDFVEKTVENIPAQEAIDQATQMVTEPVIAQQENEEVRPYQAGERIRTANGVIGRIAENEDKSAMMDANGDYIVLIETPQGPQAVSVQPRQIVNEDNLIGVENGIPVIYTNQKGEQVQDVVATDDFIYASGKIAFENGDVVPVANVIGPANQSAVNSEQSTGNQETVSSEQSTEGNTDNMQAATPQSEGFAPAGQSNLSEIEQVIANAPKQKSGEIDYDALLEQNPSGFAAVYESEEGAEETLNELQSVSGNIAKKIQAEQSKLDKADTINKKKAAKKAISELQARKQAIDNVINERYAQQEQSAEQQPGEPTDDGEQAAEEPTSEETGMAIFNSPNEITDEDFINPSRDIQLPSLPENTLEIINSEAKPVVIKKTILEKNSEAHLELSPQDSRDILTNALYNPDLVGQSQPQKRNHYWLTIKTGEKNATVVIDVYPKKDAIEIVGWRYINEKGIDKLKRQAEREGGQILILSPGNGSAAALSALPSSSESKDSEIQEEKQDLSEKDIEKLINDIRNVKDDDIEKRNKAIAGIYADFYSRFGDIEDAHKKFRDDVNKYYQEAYEKYKAQIPEQLKSKEGKKQLKGLSDKILSNNINFYQNNNTDAGVAEFVNKDIALSLTGQYNNPDFGAPLVEGIIGSNAYIKAKQELLLPELQKEAERRGINIESENEGISKLADEQISQSENEEMSEAPAVPDADKGVNVATIRFYDGQQITGDVKQNKDGKITINGNGRNYTVPVERIMSLDDTRFQSVAPDIEEVNNRFNEQLQQQIDGTLPKGHTYSLGMPSAILQSARIPDLPIVLKSDRLAEKASENYIHAHPFDLSEVKDLPKSITNPMAIFSYGDKEKAVNLITEIEKNGKKFLVGISLNPVVKGKALEINSVRNVFPKDTHEWVNWINQGKGLYFNKEKVLNFLTNSRHPADVAFGFPDESGATRNSKLSDATKIVENFENPTIREQNTSKRFIPVEPKGFKKVIKLLDKTGLAKEVIADEAKMREYLDNYTPLRFMSTPNGDTYGFVTPDGTVYLDPNKMNANTPIHEFAHLWNHFIKENNPELWAKGVELIKETSYFRDVINDEAYRNLFKGTSAGQVNLSLQTGESINKPTDEAIDRFADEALAWAMGDKGETVWHEQQDITLYARMKAWLYDAWNWIMEKTGLRAPSGVNIEDMTLEDFTDMAIGELLGGKKITVNSEQSAVNSEQGPGEKIRQQNTDNSTDGGINLVSLAEQIKDGNYEQVKQIAGRVESGDATITRLDPEEERARIKAGRRAIEATILAGTTGRADSARLRGVEAEASDGIDEQENILRDYAEKEGILFSREDIENMSSKKLPSGAESEVYESKDGENVIKVVNYKMYSESPLEFLDNRIALNNHIFDETPYKLIGFTETEHGLSFVLTQPFIQGENLERLYTNLEGFKGQQSRIKDYMRDNLDMQPAYKSPTSFANSNYVIEDLHLNNVKEGADGNLYFIDSVISLNEPHDELNGEREYQEFDVTENNDARFQFAGEQGAANLDRAEEATTRLDNLQVAREMEEFFDEKKKQIEKLRKSMPVKITGEEYKGKYDLNRDSAKDYIKDNLRGEYTNNDTGEKIEVRKDGAQKITSHSAGNEAHLKSIVAIPQLIENGIFIEEMPNKKNNNKYNSYRYYVAGLKIGDIDYTVKVVIGVDSNGNKWYDHSLTEIEKGKLIDEVGALSPTLLSDNKVTLSGIKDTKLLSILQTNEKENARRIKLATGWERGADGKWRYEMPDSQTTRAFKDLNTGESMSLGRALADEALFKAYPELRDIKVEITDTRREAGSWNPSSKTIELSAYIPAYKDGKLQSDEIFDINAIDEGFRNVLLHEMQHAIQDIEGFSRGANMNTFSDTSDLAKAYTEFDGNVKLLEGDKYENIGHVLNDERYSGFRSMFASDVKEGKFLLDGLSGNYKTQDKDTFMANYEDFVKSGAKGTAKDQYMRTAGEVEARNASRRMNMTSEDRLNSLAEETEDVSREDQIFLYDSLGQQNSDADDIRFQSVSDLADATGSTMTEELRNDLDRRIKNFRFRIREAWEDRHLAVKEFLDTLRKNGTEVAEHNDFYMKATHINGIVDAQLEQYRNKYQKPLNATIRELEKAGFDYREIENYAILKHGLERNAWMKQDAINQYTASNPDATPEQIARFEAKLPDDYSGITAVEKETGKHAEWFINDFEEKAGKDLIGNLWKRVKDATSYSLNKQLEGQLIDKKTIDDLKSRYDYYIPLRGHDAEVAEDRWDYSPDMGTYFVAPLLKAKGRKTRSESPFAYISSMAQSAISSANRNILNQTILRLAIKDKTNLLSVNKAWYEKTGEQDGKPVYEVRSPEYNEDPEIYRKNIEEFEQRMTKLAEAGLAIQSGKKLDIGGLFIKRKQADQHEVHVWQNGVEHVVYINANPAIARAINGSNAKDLHKDLRFVAKVSRQMAANFTTRNPVFVATNFSRDYIFASSILPVKEDAKYAIEFQRNILRHTGALQRYIRGKADLSKQQDRYVIEYIMNGAKTGFSHILELQKVQKQIERDIKKGEGRNAFRYLLDGLEGMNEFAENLSRLAVYATSRERGRSVTRSVSDAKEITVNFNRSGAGGYGAAWFRSLYLFVNAGIQALSNFAKVAQKNKGKTAILISSYAMSGFLMPMLTALIGGDDGLDEYMKLSDWERQNNLCLYTGNGFIKIPLPHELRVFHAMGDNIYQAAFGRKDTTETLLDVILSFSDLIPANPMGAIQGSWADVMPDATKPFFQLKANRNFTGSRIVNEWADENKPGYLRVRTNKKGEPYAPAFLVKLGELLDTATGGDGVEKGLISFNPDEVNHILRGYFGGLYTIGTQVATIGEKAYEFADTGELKLKVRETPLKAFYTSADDLMTASSGLSSKYFKITDQIKETERKIKGYQEQAIEGKMTGDEAEAKIDKIVPDIEKYTLLKRYIKNIDEYEKSLKDLDGQDQKDLEKMISDWKKEAIEINSTAGK